MHTPESEAETLELSRTPAFGRDVIRDVVLGHLRFANDFGPPLERGARILDFGCGLGSAVRVLLEFDYDGYGVDILESWGDDYDRYWHQADRPPPEVVARLRKIDPRNYRLPFDDNSFDFCFSDQVFEHVFDYEAVFRELGRVLKPGAISVHRFPGPTSPIEAHIEVPFIPLCRYRWYLALFAIMGKRSARQRGFDWRQTLQSDMAMMSQCNYPTMRTLRKVALRAGVRIELMTSDGLEYTSFGRASAVVRSAKRLGLGWFVTPAMSFIAQRYLVLFGA